MKRKTILSIGSIAVFLLCSLLVVSGVWAKDPVGEPGRSSGKKNPLNNVYFGEQHLHTSNSPDAFAAGSRQTWDEAFRYGRGEEVTLHTIATKNKIKRRTPYDFMAITDHAEYFSVMPRLIDLGVLIRMNPAKAMNSAPAWWSVALIAASIASRSPL